MNPLAIRRALRWARREGVHRQDPPQVPQGEPRWRASARGIVMQFFVQRSAQVQLKQWYLREDVLKATISVAAPGSVATASSER
jgi:hypothetical protein